MMKIRYKAVLIILLSSIACKSDHSTGDHKIVEFNTDWFEASTIGPDTYSIEERKSSQGNVSYLISGESRTIVFDTGSGENEPQGGLKIRPLIEKLTSLPYTLLLSHFHFDHDQNITEFKDVGFPDLPFLRQKVSEDDVYSFSEEDLFLGDFPKDVQVDEWLPINTDIDLGKRTIKVLNIPGHTPESVAILDETNKMIFLGDYMYNGDLFLFNDEDLVPYKESVEYLFSVLTNDYKLYGAHGKPQIAFEKLEKLKNLLECIEQGDCKATASKIWGKDVNAYQLDNMKIVIFQ